MATERLAPLPTVLSAWDVPGNHAGELSQLKSLNAELVRRNGELCEQLHAATEARAILEMRLAQAEALGDVGPLPGPTTRPGYVNAATARPEHPRRHAQQQPRIEPERQLLVGRVQCAAFSSEPVLSGTNGCVGSGVAAAASEGGRNTSGHHPPTACSHAAALAAAGAPAAECPSEDAEGAKEAVSRHAPTPISLYADVGDRPRDSPPRECHEQSGQTCRQTGNASVAGADDFLSRLAVAESGSRC